MPSRQVLGGATLAVTLAACHPARTAPPPATRHVALHLVGDECPAAYLHVRYASEGFPGLESTGDSEGNVDLELGPGRYDARLTACGRPVHVTLDDRTPPSVSLRIDPLDRAGASQRGTWPRRPLESPARRRCRFELAPSPSPVRVLAGSYSDVRLDKGGCGLIVRASDIDWLYTPDAPNPGPVRLGSMFLASSAARLVALDAGRVVSVDRRAGARTVVAPVPRRVTLLPRTDLLVATEWDARGERMSLDVTWPDGRTRHLSDRADTRTAWSDDGRWFVFLDDAQSDGCPALRVLDVTLATDRAAVSLCHVPGWGSPRFVGSHHVLAASASGYVAIDASTAQVLERFAPDSRVAGFAHGVIVEAPRQPDRSALWNLDTGARIPLGFGFETARPLPSGDLVAFRLRPDLVSEGSPSATFEAIFVDAGTGAARRLATGVTERVAAQAGAIVLEEEERFVALRMGEEGVTTLPRRGETVVALDTAGRWMALDGPMHKGRPTGHEVVSLTGDRRPRADIARRVTRGVWAPDRPAYVFAERPRFHLEGEAVPAMGLFVLRVDEARTIPLARSIESFAVLDDGQVAYAVPGDGIYIDTLDGK